MSLIGPPVGNVVGSPVGSPIALPYQGGGAPSFYIDFDAGGTGDGSIGDPYDDFTEFELLTGDQEGANWLVKKGAVATFTGMVLNSAAWNYTLSTYGTGTRPIIDANSANNNCINVSGPNLTISGFELLNANQTCLIISDALPAPDNLSITDMEAHDNNGSLPLINLAFSGTATNVRLTDNNCHDSSGNAFEFRSIDGMVCQDNEVNVTGNVYEAWAALSNATLQRTKASNITNFLWLANGLPGGPYTYDDITVKNNRVFTASLDFIRLTNIGSNFSGLKVYNNTYVGARNFINSRNNAFTQDIQMLNNLVYCRLTTGGVTAIDLKTATNITTLNSEINNNYYYTNTDTNLTKFHMPVFTDGAGTTYNAGDTAGANPLFAWATATGFDVNSWGGEIGPTIDGPTQDITNLFTNLAAGDLSLVSGALVRYDQLGAQASTGSPAVSDNLTDEDVEGAARPVNNDVGGYQFTRP